MSEDQNKDKPATTDGNETSKGLAGNIDSGEFPAEESDFDTEFQALIAQLESGDIPLGDRDSVKAHELYRDAMEILKENDEVAVVKARNLLQTATTLDEYCFDAQRALALLSGSVENRTQRLQTLVEEAKAHFESIHLLDERTTGTAWDTDALRPYLRLKSELAYSYFDQGRYTMSLAECTDLLELTRADTQGIRCLTMILYAYFEDRESALALYERFDEERNVWFLTSLAILAYKTNDLSNAEKYLITLVQYCPSALSVFITGGSPDTYTDNYERGSLAEASAAYDDVSLLLDTTYGFIDWIMTYGDSPVTGLN